MRAEKSNGCCKADLFKTLTVSIIFCVAWVVGVAGTWAAGGHRYRNPEAAALGFDSPTRVLALFDLSQTKEKWWVEAGQWRLYDLADLASNGAELGLSGDRFGLVVSSLFLSSAIGMESRYFASVMYSGPRRIRVAIGLGADVVALHGFERAITVTGAVSGVVDLTESVRMISTIDRVRIAGESLSGADVALAVVLFPRAVASVLARVAVSRRGILDTGVGSRVRFSRVFSAAAGYDETTGMLKGSVLVDVRSLGVQVGATVHPVLGVSKAVFISWRR